MHDLSRLEEALTSKKWKFEFIQQDECPRNLAEFYDKFLPHLSQDTFNERIRIGGFYVNGLSIDKNVALKVPCKVEYYEPKFSLSEISLVYPAFSKDWIIYEDEYLIFLFKPRRLPCLPTKEQKVYNLKTYLEAYAGENIHMPSRLDTSTEGIIVISKNPLMHNYLQQAFEKKIVIKRYLFKSANKAAWIHKVLRVAIAKSRTHAILREVSEQGGKDSVTIFSNYSDKDNNLFLARPLTGRTHQIRLHASHLGIPILGDNFYGGARSDRLHLLSYELEIWHPYKKEFLSFKLPENLRPDWAKV